MDELGETSTRGFTDLNAVETSSGCYTGEGSAISGQLIVRVRNTAAMRCLQQMKIKGDA